MRLDTTPFVDVSDDLNELAEQVHIEGGGPPKARRRRRRRRDAGSGGMTDVVPMKAVQRQVVMVRATRAAGRAVSSQPYHSRAIGRRQALMRRIILSNSAITHASRAAHVKVSTGRPAEAIGMAAGRTNVTTTTMRRPTIDAAAASRAAGEQRGAGHGRAPQIPTHRTHILRTQSAVQLVSQNADRCPYLPAAPAPRPTRRFVSRISWATAAGARGGRRPT